jgi:peptidoglycan/LPS O-acetylase OafA/YrhL
MKASMSRQAFLDGLRGLACLQVVLLHVANAYFPGLVENHASEPTIAGWIRDSPIFAIYDGYMAIFLFFIISGFVLTTAYEKSALPAIDEIKGRVMRLWLPTTAFGLWSLLFFEIFWPAHLELSTIVNSNWLGSCWQVNTSAAELLRDIFVTPVLGSYSAGPIHDIFPEFARHLPHTWNSLNAPTWTMSAELQGSILILACVRLRARSPLAWAGVMFCVVRWAPGAFGAFAIGQIAAVMRLADLDFGAMRRLVAPITILLIGAAVAMAGRESEGIWPFAAGGLIFLGVTISPFCRQFLTRPALTRLGERSFVIYLSHWALVYGPGAWLTLHAIDIFGLQFGRIIGASFVIALTLGLSGQLVAVDRIAIAVANGIKRRQYTDLAGLVTLARNALPGKVQPT